MVGSVPEEVEPTEPIDAYGGRDEPLRDRGAALLRSLAERRFPDIDPDQLRKLREPRHSGADE
jgi:hypothetical protein